MTALVSASNTQGPRLVYVNSAPSTAITNTTTETVFDTIATYPSQSQRYTLPITRILLEADGVMSTGLLNLGLTIRCRWGGLSGPVIATTGSFTAAASLSSNGWSSRVKILIDATGPSGQIETQGFCSFSSGLISISASQMANSSTFSTDMTQSYDVVLTAQWGTATANNSIQARIMEMQIDGP